MAKTDVHGFISEIENICQCSICFNEYDGNENIPRVLPCQHTFCTNCLSQQCRGKKLKCPFCNQEHNLRDGDINTLPKDYTRRDLKELLDNFSKQFCKECENHFHVQYICQTCNARMCHICYNQRKAGQCMTHNFEKQEVISASAMDTPTSSVCTQTGHENNELKFFCTKKSCCKAVCANCVVESHENHSKRPILDEYNERKKKFLSVYQATRDKIAHAELFLDGICEYCNLITKIDKIGRANLMEQAERGMKYIKDFKLDVEKTADERFQKCVKILEKRQEQVKCFIENSTECCAISNEALSGGNMVAFLSVEKTLTEKLKSFVQDDVDKPFTTQLYSEFELQATTVELKGKIDRLSSQKSETTETQSITAIQEHPSFMQLSVFLIIVLSAVVWILLRCYPVPYAHVFDVDNTKLIFLENPLSRVCFSIDRRMVSSRPMQNMKQTCGNTQSPYIYRGAFTNSSFTYGKGEHIVFLIDVSKIQKYSPGLILYEFGVSKGAIERQDLLGPRSSDFFGWMLTILNKEREVALINTEGHVVLNRKISVFDEASFTYYIEFKSNKTIVLKTKDKNEKLFLDETRSIKGKYKMGFAKVCPSVNADVTVKLLRNNMAFNRSTLYPNVYLSVDNKTISNHPMSHFHKKQIWDHVYQDIMLLNCNRECVYLLKFRVKSPNAADVFSLVLTNSQFLPSAHYNLTLFTYTRCLHTKYYVSYESFCFLAYKDNSRYSFVPLVPDQWHSITIMINRKRKSASFMIENNEVQVENGYFFEDDTPVLRLVMFDMKDDVEVYLADSDDYHILTMFNFNFFQFIDYFSFIPFFQHFIFGLFIIMVIAQCMQYMGFLDVSQENVYVDTERNIQERRRVPRTSRRRRF